MKNVMKYSALALALAIAAPVTAAPDADSKESGWHCTDTRDQYTFQFNGDRSRNLGIHPQHGNIVQVETTEGWVIRMSESQLETVYRCMKRPGEKFEYDQ
jgi:hypothetical protein